VKKRGITGQWFFNAKEKGSSKGKKTPRPKKGSEGEGGKGTGRAKKGLGKSYLKKSSFRLKKDPRERGRKIEVGRGKSYSD